MMRQPAEGIRGMSANIHPGPPTADRQAASKGIEQELMAEPLRLTHQGTPIQDPGWAELMKKAEQAVNEVHAELERLESFRSSMSLHRPLRRKILGRMCSHLNSIQVAAGVAQERSGDGTATPRLSVSGNAQQVVVLALGEIKDLGKRGTATIWEIKNRLRIAYLGILNDMELYARIMEERKAADEGTYRRRARLPEADVKQLEEGIKEDEFKPSHLRNKAIMLLRKLYDDIDDNGRYERAVTEHRGLCLKWITLSMFCTIIVMSIPLINYGLESNYVREGTPMETVTYITKLPP